MSKIKLIVFDLDGVLVDTTQLHYDCFNEALATYGEQYVITHKEHIEKYNGYPTKYKLDLLTKEKGLSRELHNDIWKLKQKITQESLSKYLIKNDDVINTLKKLGESYKIYVASNSIWKTIKNSLYYTGLLEYVDYFISCEDVTKPKPSAEIYFKCFNKAQVNSSEVLILEDSPTGLKSAYGSGANVMEVKSIKEDITYDKIISRISEIENTHRPIPMDVNILIPMAGHGSRFAKAGYKMPKPLIDVNGKAMIQSVIENIGIKGRNIFIVQKEHYEKYYLQILLNAISPNCKIVITEGVTEGAACSVLLAKDYIDNDKPLIIANSDQNIEWGEGGVDKFVEDCMKENIDGCISIFKNNHAKFSYAKLGENGYVDLVAEKKVISENATTGIYYWKKGSDFVKYAEEMIKKNIRVNNEFYVAPVFNQAIEDGKKIITSECYKFHCLGTPEDLEAYLRK